VKVVVPYELYQQIRAVTMAVESEVCAWVEGEYSGGVVTLSKMAIPPQEAGGTHADVNTEQTVTLLQMGELDVGKALCSWHSHADLETEFSGTDHSLYAAMADIMPIAVGLVTNKKNKWNSVVLLNTGKGTALSVPSTVEFVQPDMPESAVQMAKVAVDRVKKPVKSTPMLGGNGRGFLYDSTGAMELWITNGPYEMWMLASTSMAVCSGPKCVGYTYFKLNHGGTSKWWNLCMGHGEMISDILESAGGIAPGEDVYELLKEEEGDLDRNEADARWVAMKAATR